MSDTIPIRYDSIPYINSPDNTHKSVKICQICMQNIKLHWSFLHNPALFLGVPNLPHQGPNLHSTITWGRICRQIGEGPNLPGPDLPKTKSGAGEEIMEGTVDGPL